MINMQENVSLAPYTTFNIGGKAKFFVEVKSKEDLVDALNYTKENELEYFILSGGSNVLISDSGFNGLVMKIALNELLIEGTSVYAEAGCVLMDVIHDVSEAGLAGMESMYGIPGSVGGAVRGNAGAFGVEMKDCVKEVIALNVRELRVEKFVDLEFGYRTSFFKKNPHLIILSASIELEKGADSYNKALMTLALRNERQIQGIQSAGSFFMNPVVNREVQEMFLAETGIESQEGMVPAGWLIEKSGFKGFCENGICTGERSSNYVINKDGNSEAVINLTNKIKEKVLQDSGVELIPEVTAIDNTR